MKTVQVHLITGTTLNVSTSGFGACYTRISLRPGLYDIGLLFKPDRFCESGTKTAQESECLH